ncbi:MAG: DUF1802 domain-containing protein [Cyanobacteria bacterium SW_11_48_12]|nr:MAG: DUF1802 domain-containing protein [Cyanobacteria bacterium SW_11_48_12]
MSLTVALRLSTPDIEALIQGRTIAAMPRTFIHPGRQFALYPGDTSINALPSEQYYRSDFLPTAQQALANLDSETVSIQAWAKCDRCEILDETEAFDFLSQLTVWTEMPVRYPPFISLKPSVTATEEMPVLSDRLFTQRCQQMQARKPPLHPELEQLQGAIASFDESNLAAKELHRDIKALLGWVSEPPLACDSDYIWIEQIAAVGNSSDGNEFERLVRKSLIKLGFFCTNDNPKANLDPDKLGGAGGVDFYGEQPYPIVGECKASKSENVPSKTPGQLIQLGNNHLQDQYESCLKLVVAAGELTENARLTAVNNQISVIRPETLQNLVEMQTRHPHSIDLLKLKECLQAAYGLADEKVEQYLAEVRQQIELRSHLVGVVKNYQENNSFDSAGVNALHGAYSTSHPPLPLTAAEMHEILIELSSPLAGYLGREKGSDGRGDRFYFRRDLADIGGK